MCVCVSEYEWQIRAFCDEDERLYENFPSCYVMQSHEALNKAAERSTRNKYMESAKNYRHTHTPTHTLIHTPTYSHTHLHTNYHTLDRMKSKKSMHLHDSIILAEEVLQASHSQRIRTFSLARSVGLSSLASCSSNPV